MKRVITEVVIGGLWCASAVKVFGYTWASITSTWSTLPGPGSGSKSATAAALQRSINKNEDQFGTPNSLTGVIDALEHPLRYPSNTGKGTFGLHGPITRALGNFFGNTVPGFFSGLIP